MDLDPTPTPSPVVLVVDDREENLIAMRQLLGRLECEVVTAASGQGALEIAFSGLDIAVVLLDVQMPGMDGFQTAETMRLNNSTRAVPIIFVTAMGSDAEHVFRGYDCGAVDFLAKPVAEHILLSKVNVFLEMSRNRSEIQRARAELEEARAELVRSNDSLQAFAHTAAHDLKAPLRHITGWIGMIIHKYAAELPETLVNELREIDGSTSRMHDLISGLLRYAEIDASPASLIPIPIGAVINESLSRLADVVSETGAVVTVESMPEVIGDEMLLGQLFQNLLDNALKYRRSGVAPCVVVSSEIDPFSTMCTISVRDNGMGFDDEYAHTIFEPFKRLVGSGEFAGSGIGMATAKKVVALHGGEISAHGSSGSGATFVVTLPLSVESVTSVVSAS